MGDDTRLQKLDSLYQQLKKWRTAQAEAEERHKEQAQYGHCLECELRNIRAHIEDIERQIARVLEE